MQQVQTRGIRPPSFLRVAERAAHTMQLVTDGAQLPPNRAAQYRSWRSNSDKPSPLERVKQSMVELHGCGVRIDRLRAIPQSLHELLDDLSTGLAHPTLTAEMWERETALEAVENAANLRALLHDADPEAHEDAARALRAEALHGMEMARAHEKRARDLRRGR